MGLLSQFCLNGVISGHQLSSYLVRSQLNTATRGYWLRPSGLVRFITARAQPGERSMLVPRSTAEIELGGFIYIYAIPTCCEGAISANAVGITPARWVSLN